MPQITELHMSSLIIVIWSRKLWISYNRLAHYPTTINCQRSCSQMIAFIGKRIEWYKPCVLEVNSQSKQYTVTDRKPRFSHSGHEIVIENAPPLISLCSFHSMFIYYSETEVSQNLNSLPGWALEVPHIGLGNVPRALWLFHLSICNYGAEVNFPTDQNHIA